MASLFPGTIRDSKLQSIVDGGIDPEDGYGSHQDQLPTAEKEYLGELSNLTDSNATLLRSFKTGKISAKHYYETVLNNVLTNATSSTNAKYFPNLVGKTSLSDFSGWKIGIKANSANSKDFGLIDVLLLPSNV